MLSMMLAPLALLLPLAAGLQAPTLALRDPRRQPMRTDDAIRTLNRVADRVIHLDGWP
jgi:hypothetical protein